MRLNGTFIEKSILSFQREFADGYPKQQIYSSKNKAANRMAINTSCQQNRDKYNTWLVHNENAMMMKKMMMTMMTTMIVNDDDDDSQGRFRRRPESARWTATDQWHRSIRHRLPFLRKSRSISPRARHLYKKHVVGQVPMIRQSEERIYGKKQTKKITPGNLQM